jgi:transposase
MFGMARNRQPLDLKGEAELVLTKLKDEPAGWRRERLLAVKLGLEGELDLETIAKQVGRARASIQLWFKAYREGGVALLLKKGKGIGPKPWVSGEIATQMSEKLAAGQWRTGEEARQWLEKEHGIVLAPNSIYKVLGKFGGRLKVPRPVHRKKDEKKAEAFKQEVCRRLEALEIPSEKAVRVWVQDEMRFGLQPVTRRAWGLPGVRIVKPVQQRYEWGYVYGALEVGGGGAEFSYLPTVNKEATRLHLEQISASDPESIHVIIWDGAGFHHRDGEEEIPTNVRLIQLPAYSPELNPVEKLWDIVKDGICNRFHENLDALEEEITERLRPYWEDVRRVKSLIGEGWLLAEVNAT